MNEPRLIEFNGKRLPDFDPTMNIEQIRAHYSQQYPELTTASPVVEVREGKRVTTFKKSAGTKG